MASRSAPVDSSRGPFHTPSRRPRHFPGPGLGHQSDETWVPELVDAVELDDPSPHPLWEKYVPLYRAMPEGFVGGSRFISTLSKTRGEL